MRRQSLDIYDDMPSAMKRYISNYGWHFNKAAFEFATKLMTKRDSSGKEVSVNVPAREDIDKKLQAYGVHLDNNTLYDAAFVWCMGTADYLGSSITDESHLAKYVKDTIDDVDASPETTFRRWLATMVGNGQPVSWEDLV